VITYFYNQGTHIALVGNSSCTNGDYLGLGLLLFCGIRDNDATSGGFVFPDPADQDTVV
jgi:hypothetical protein